ncbi:MAG: aminoacyl-tRNA hydrolase [Candidatus Hydrogenedentota bacterium]|nr:MAG: aminoacyl-tRNA hydrolase [Candidatus Hydrogenedentota bacterium]
MGGFLYGQFSAKPWHAHIVKKPSIKLIVGLGNPTEEYQFTRHNAGFLALDFLFPDAHWKMQKKLKALVAKANSTVGTFQLLKPMTYMNLSGQAVCPALKYYGLQPENMLVLHDEIDLPAGEVKLKFSGGHRGHNGLRDIIQCAGNNFYRIRIGVGRPENPQESVADFLLKKFNPDSLPYEKIKEVFEALFL